MQISAFNGEGKNVNRKVQGVPQKPIPDNKREEKRDMH